MKNIITALCFTFIVTFAHTQTADAKYKSLLSKYVTSAGSVNYTGLKSNLSEVNSILDTWSKVDVAKLSSNDALAFYINLYNLQTIQLITSNFPLKSIKDLAGGKPWDTAIIAMGGKKISLNDLENKIIRPKYNDARVHFALNCGAVSCPPLANYPLEGSKINSQLDQLTKTFINSKSTSITSSKIVLSSIFDWYKSDFGNIFTFLSKYSSAKVVNGAPISFATYNWSVNGK